MNRVAAAGVPLKELESGRRGLCICIFDKIETILSIIHIFKQYFLTLVVIHNTVSPSYAILNNVDVP